MRTIPRPLAAALALAASACSESGAGPAGERGPEGPTGPLPQIAVAGGLTGDGSSAAPLAVAFAGSGAAASVCRSDHDHDALYLTSVDGAPAGHDHDGSYAATAHDHDARYRTRAEEDAAFAASAHLHTYAQVTDAPNLADYARKADLPDLSVYPTKTQLDAALAALPAPLRSATFTAWLANPDDFTTPTGSTATLLEYTNVVQNSDASVFEVAPDGSLVVLKPGTVSITAGFDFVSESGPYARLDLRVNTTNRASAVAPPSAGYSHVSATLHWTVSAGDQVGAYAYPSQIAAMDNDPLSILTVLWTGQP